MNRTSIGIFSRLITVLLVGAFAFAAFLVVGVVTGAGGPFDVGVHAKVEPEQLRDVEGKIESVDVVVRVEHPDDSQVRWSSARDLAPAVFFLAVLWLLHPVLRSARDGEPFTRSTVWRLRWLGAVFAVGLPLATFLRSVFAAGLAHTAGLPAPGIHLTVVGVYAYIVLLILAEVFAAGVQMRDELEGTV